MNNFSFAKYLLLAVIFHGQQVQSAETATTSLDKLERVTQELVTPPFLPKHSQVADSEPKIVQVRMTVQEKEMQIERGLKAHVMTFNGSIPGPIIVVHQNDYVELTLVNPITNSMTHNIDFHAATGALGGGALTKIVPGQEVVLRFKAIKAGVFIYHCAPGGLMIPLHVAMGLSGAIMVLPRDGLRDDQGHSITYDKAYYIGEQGYYFPKDDDDGSYISFSSALDSLPGILRQTKKLIPSHTVFNGAVGALTGENALTAKVGEKVLFIHSQGNEDSRPHLIGGHADLVWEGGSFNDKPVTDRKTWFIPGGSALASLYEFKQPGTYVYLNHNLIQALQLGALAHVQVEGEWDNDLMEQVSGPSAI
ncbi:MAG TPA: nitrite reductase, copper-containing [Methyloprofundus sp.]|nr:nitrite reductase, copper-containing [Methyloprofundus sp.]HIL76610.1 nitrite reductase, copper-containing [Rhodospirillales bacterium]